VISPQMKQTVLEIKATYFKPFLNLLLKSEGDFGEKKLVFSSYPF
jgi:hypothetical protein